MRAHHLTSASTFAESLNFAAYRRQAIQETIYPMIVGADLFLVVMVSCLNIFSFVRNSSWATQLYITKTGEQGILVFVG